MAGSWCTLGVDLGSTTAKAVVVGADGRMLSSSVVQMGAVSRKAVDIAVDRALNDAGVSREGIVRTISTGYGRKLVPGADRTFTEITCHARGAVALAPGVRLVVDIGGQDSKAIAIGTDGLVDRFAINDRCASGTGRFFDVLSRALEVDVADVADLALASDRDVEVSGMCATFAETEVISLLAQGEEPADIAASVHRSVAGRTMGLIAQVGKAAPVVMTGGVARNRAFVAELSRALGLEITILNDPQIAGALGAALIAREDHLGALAAAADAADTVASDAWDRAKAAPAPHCDACDGHPEIHSSGPVRVELVLNRPGVR
jgi:predicted CoA-substrate-specific enzyme activase